MSNSFEQSEFATRWHQFSLAEQMGNIGSEVDRFIKVRGRGNQEQSLKAFDRALELIDLTKSDPRWLKQGRIKEINRIGAGFCDAALYNGEEFNTPLDYFSKYFMQFALVARERHYQK